MENKMHISDILRRKGSTVFAIDHEQPLRDAVRLMRDENVGAVAVLNLHGNQPVGIVSRRHLSAVLNVMGSAALAHCAAGVMRRPAPRCASDATPGEALAQMRRQRTEHLLVSDASGGVVGIVSLGDLAAAGLGARRVDASVLPARSPIWSEREAA